MPAPVALPAPGTYPLVEPVTALTGSDPVEGSLTVQRGHEVYWLREEPACRHVQVAAVQTLFVRRSDAVAGPGAELLVLGEGACPIVDGGPR